MGDGTGCDLPEQSSPGIGDARTFGEATLVIPIGDENPRSRTPYVSWGFAAAVALAYVPMTVGKAAPGGFGGFLLSPVLSGDIVSAVWIVLAALILADNVEDRLGPLWHACLLVGSGWIGAAARSVAASGAGTSWFGALASSPPYAGASAAATAAAVAYALLFPLHQIRFWHVFTSRRRRGLFSLFDDRPPSSGEFYVSAPLGIFLWGLGVLAGAVGGANSAGDFAALVAGGAAGAALGFGLRVGALARQGAPALPVEFEDASPSEPRWWRGGEPWWRSGGNPGPVAPKAMAAPRPFAVGGWAVLRETDELYDVGRLGRISARHMRVPVADATRRIRQTRGVIARGMERGRAEALAAEVSAAGVPAFAVDEAEGGGLPQPQVAASAGAGPPGFEFEFEGRKAALAWGEVAVVAAARVVEEDEQATVVDARPDAPVPPQTLVTRRVTQTTLIDVVTHRPARRFRIARQEATAGGAGDLSSAGFRGFAASVLKHRGAAPLNKGLSVIAGRGAWGYLSFPSHAAYEEYLWWLLHVIRRRSGAAAGPKPPAPGPASRASWLE